MTRILIAENLIPRTCSTVKLEQLDGSFVVTRQAGVRFNYLSCGRKTEAEARTAANDLWTDARDRTLAASRTETTVPAGRYAVENAEGKLGFYRVSRPESGRWAGKTFVNVQASDDEYPVRGAAAVGSILTKIAVDPAAAAQRYGQEIGRCSRCGRTLTDEISRAAGMGPDCRSKF